MSGYELKLQKTFEYQRPPLDRGYANQTLQVDAASKDVAVKPVAPQMKDLFIGGKGFDLWLLWNAVTPKTRWNDPENAVCIACGPLGGTPAYPGSGKSIAATISPLTGQAIDSNVTGEIDVLIRNTTWTIIRDAAWGNFGPTTFYDGQGMMVRQDLGATTLEELQGATICVQTGTTTELNMTDQMRARGVEFEPVVFDDIDATYAAYEEGRCDAVTSDKSQLAARRTVFPNPADHIIMEVTMSKEPLGPVVPHGDDQWFNIVKWTVFATFEAEELGITSQNVDDLLTSENPVVRRLLGVEGELGQELGLSNDFAANIIRQVGNYGEIFNRNLGPDTPFDMARGQNELWTNGGLLYSPPFR